MLPMRSFCYFWSFSTILSKESSFLHPMGGPIVMLLYRPCAFVDMGANQNIPKNAEKFCGSFYKDDFSEFYPESVFRSENGSKLSIFGPKYVFFVNSVPDVYQIIKILKIYLLMLPMRIFCYLWNFRTTSQKKCI